MAPPPELMDELIGEILLRLPPDEPEHLFRAALVCKPWLRVLCDLSFRRRYHAFHGAPPLLGLLHGLVVTREDLEHRFAPTTAVTLSPLPDCRHGRVLLQADDPDWRFIVWDPITGKQQRLPEPEGIPWRTYTGAVLCTAAGCNHLDCHGGPFCIVFVTTDYYKNTVTARVYSSETGVWSAPASLDDGCQVYARHVRDAPGDITDPYTPYIKPMRCALIGDEIYCTIWWRNAIVKYNWASNCLSMINPPLHNAFHNALMVMDDNTLGFACTESSCLYLWSRKVNSEGAAEWVPRKAIELEKIMPAPNSWDESFVAGFAEGVDVIFISSDIGLFTIELESRKVRKLAETGEYFSVLPYMSFYTPSHSTLLSIITGKG
ncbi:unnamed protein product [Urochloa humidicola]